MHRVGYMKASGLQTRPGGCVIRRPPSIRIFNPLSASASTIYPGITGYKRIANPAYFYIGRNSTVNPIAAAMRYKVETVGTVSPRSILEI